MEIVQEKSWKERKCRKELEPKDNNNKKYLEKTKKKITEDLNKIGKRSKKN